MGSIYGPSNDTSVVIASPGTLVLPNATFSQTGIYHVSVKVGGCTSATANFAVQVKSALPPAVITGTSFLCEGDSLAPAIQCTGRCHILMVRAEWL
jgi:hypothetical protein